MTAITSGRVTIPAWRVVRAAWFRNRMTLIVLLAVFTVAAGWTLYQADSMRSWLIARHIQQCIVPVNAVSSACEADPPGKSSPRASMRTLSLSCCWALPSCWQCSAGSAG
jgi:hypothetical protein